VAEEWRSLAAVARNLDVAESTARRWANLFEDFLQSKGHGAGRRFHSSAEDVLRRVRDLYAQNLSAHRIRETLTHEFSMFIDGDTPQNAVQASPAPSPEDMMQLIAQMISGRLADELNALREEVAATKAENAELRSVIEQRLDDAERVSTEQSLKLDAALGLLNDQTREGRKTVWQRLLGK